MCFHCEEEIDVDAVVDCVGEKFCSTRCAVAVATYGHSEACRALACADNAPLTLPPMLCAFCEQPTKGETAHVSCREKVKRALALQDAAYGARAS